MVVGDTPSVADSPFAYHFTNYVWRKLGCNRSSTCRTFTKRVGELARVTDSIFAYSSLQEKERDVNYPKNVLKAAKKAAEKYPSDIDKAVATAEKEIRRLDEFEELVGLLVTSAVEDLVYDARHATNRRIRHSVKGRGVAKPKVIVGRSRGVQKVCDNIYQYNIAGTTLGLLRGNQLVKTADSERAIANGHSVNVVLCLKLSKIVKGRKVVQTTVSQKRLHAIFRQSQKEAA